jgi:hypothetical protein
MLQFFQLILQLFPGRINQPINDNSYFLNYFKLPLIYQGTITYFPDFSHKRYLVYLPVVKNSIHTL